MPKKRRNTMLLAAVTSFALITAACGDDSNDAANPSGGGNTPATSAAGSNANLSGNIRIDGSSTVGPLSEVAAELYMAKQRGVRVSVAMSGTSGGFQKFCTGENDMNNASRPIKESEIELCKGNGIRYEGVQVANDALALLVNKDNPVACLSVEQARQIWDQDSPVRRWGDVTGLNIPADMASQRITLYGPGTDSGTFDFFTEEINGKSGQIRNDYTNIGEDDHMAVNGVAGDRYAMGYVPYSYFMEAGDAVKPLQIDGGAGCVDATLENVQNGSYTPLGRPLFVYASDKALARPEVVDFIKFYIDNSEQIAQAATFVPMTAAQMAESHEKVAELTRG